MVLEQIEWAQPLHSEFPVAEEVFAFLYPWYIKFIRKETDKLNIFQIRSEFKTG